MRLTAFTDLGLRALMRLASEPGRSFTTDEIAGELSISRHHLSKIVRDLADAGFIATQRGAGGGFSLARPAQEISLGAVVRRLEDGHALVECFRDDGGCCTLTAGCRLKSKLVRARDAFIAELDKTSLAECAYPARPGRSVGRAASP